MPTEPGEDWLPGDKEKMQYGVGLVLLVAVLEVLAGLGVLWWFFGR